jgi:hypothetical protein
MKLRLLVLSAFLISLTSCFDVIETFNINEDGSGVYEQKMDMSRFLSFSNMMKGGKTSGKTPEKKDTLIELKSIIDTVASLSVEEKAVLGKSAMKLHIDETAGEMSFVITYPFASSNEFATIQKAMMRDGNKTIAAAVGGALGKKGGMNAPQEKQPEMPTSEFTYMLTGNSLVKKVKPSSKFESTETASNDMPPEFKEMLKMSYTTIINLPRPVKNWNGNNGTLSADKKQLKFNKSIDMETKLTPADFDFSIDF